MAERRGMREERMTVGFQNFSLPSPLPRSDRLALGVARHPAAAAIPCTSGKRGTDSRCAGAASAPLTGAPGPATVPTGGTDAPSALPGPSAYRPATSGGFRRLGDRISASLGEQATPAPAAAAAPAAVTPSPCRVWRSPASSCGRSATATRFMKRFLMDDLLRERNAYAKRVMAEVRGRRRELETVE